MRVDIVCSSRDLFGADRSAVALAEVLRKVGVEPRLLVPERRPERGLSALAAERGITTVSRPVTVVSSRGVDGAFFPRRHRDSCDLTIYNSSAVVACANTSSRRLLILREWLDPARFQHRLLARYHSVRIRGLVGISTGVLEQWKAVCAGRPEIVEKVPAWLDESWLGGRKSVGSPTGTIVCVGRFNQWKGQSVLADAYDRAFGTAAGRPGLVFVGAELDGGPFQARSLALAQRAAARGWQVVPVTSRPKEWVERAALIVVPSLHPEPFGNILLEGLAFGARVIAFPGGGPDDVALDFPESVHLVPRSTDALAGALRAWWNAGASGQEESTYAQTLVRLKRLYSKDSAVDRWRSILEKVS